jgi:hypothetical protein
MNQEPSLSYEDGIREGRVRALEAGQLRVHERINSHEKRLTAQERITYALLGALALLQLWPALQSIVQL